MGELLGENEQLTVRNFQILRWGRWRGAVSLRGFSLRPNQVDADRDTFLQFNLSDGDGSIGAIKHALHQASLRVAGTVCKLWHRCGKLVGNRRSQTRNWNLLKE